MTDGTHGNRRLIDEVAHAVGSVDRKTDAPEHDPAIVHSNLDGGLVECFVGAAEAAGAEVTRATRTSLISIITSMLDGTAGSVHLLEPALAERYPELRDLPGVVIEPTENQIYDASVGLVLASAGLAETGSVVRSAGPDRRRALALVPMTVVVVLEVGAIVPELYDLLASLDPANMPSELVAITGPSKSADIGMKLVTGVHGPGVVRIVLLEDA
jgi:L-lactate dehydrogenase complex protein LldG